MDPITYSQIRETVKGAANDPIQGVVDAVKTFNRMYQPNYVDSEQGAQGSIPSPSDFAQEALRIGEILGGQADPLSQSERQRMSDLEAEMAKNQAIKATGGSGSFNPRNRFSLDTRGASRAINQTLTDAVNDVRGKRLAEIAPEYQELAGRDQRYKETVKRRDEFAADATGDFMSKNAAHTFDMAEKSADQRHDITMADVDFKNDMALQNDEQRHDENIEEISNTFQRQMEELKQTGRVDLVALRHQNDLEIENLNNDFKRELEKMKNGGEGGSGKGYTPATFSQRASSLGLNYLDRAEKISDMLSDPMQRRILERRKVPDPQDPNKMISEFELMSRKVEEMNKTGHKFMGLSMRALEGTVGDEAMKDASTLINQILGEETGDSQPTPSPDEVTDTSNFFPQ